MEKAPDAFRTISEVADELDIPQHVLRFWESRFAQIKPMKRGGGRRYYRPDDVALLRGIRHLLYGQGYTIRGVQRILREQGVRFVQAVWEEGAEQPLLVNEDAAAAETAIESIEEDAEADVARVPPARSRQNDAAEYRREPTFGSKGDDGSVSGRSPRVVTVPDRQALQSALTELAECRRLLAAAIEDAV